MNWLRFAVVAGLSLMAMLRLDFFSESALARFEERGEGGAPIPPGPYVYVGRGHQAFVFSNRDGVVLKVFNQRRFSLPWPLSTMFPEWARKRGLRQAATLASYRLAWEEIPAETGLLQVHLAPTSDIPPVELQNRAGGRYLVDLNVLPFVLQRRCKPFYPEIEQRIAREGTRGLERSIDQLVAILDRCFERGMMDEDRDIEINYGVDGEALYLIDPGRLAHHSEENRSTALRKATRKFRRWLQENHPEATPYLDKKFIL